MRDAIELESRGIPTVTISEDAFEKPARVQAKMLGMPELPIVVIPRAQNANEDLRRRADEVFDRLIGSLTRSDL